MRLRPGDQVKRIELPVIDGSMFNMDSVEGKPFMLSFYRFASCPFCNLRINKLVKRFDEFGGDFALIAIFNSSPENLARHTAGHHAPFPILADENKIFYNSFGIQYSWVGFLKGMMMRLPTLLGGMLRGYLPAEFNHRLSIMPADFLVDAKGVIQTAYYGQDEGDHLSFDEVKAFALEKREAL